MARISDAVFSGAKVGMIVFSDYVRRIELPVELERLISASSVVASSPFGLDRHAALSRLFVSASEIAQGTVDSEFEHFGEDRLTSTHLAAIDLAREAAKALTRSWDNGFEAPAPDFTLLARRLLALSPVSNVCCRRQEGFAFYALYPEAYAAAAKACGARLGAVLGIRSIGIGLGAIVATITGARLFVSVRTVGHPFRRQLSLGADVRSAIAQSSGAAAVVDEGPGLSGSSFAAATSALDRLGVAFEAIHLFPSHRNAPGPAASPDQRRQWLRTHKHTFQLEDLLLQPRDARHRLVDWCCDLTGAPIGPLEDVGGGAWRRLRPPTAAAAPAQPKWERRKYILRSDRGVFLLRFAGLGAYGDETYRRAEQIAGAGFSPAVLGLRYGFIVERWVENAAYLDLTYPDRAGLIAHLARYLAFRATRLPSPEGAGAKLSELVAMMIQNAAEALNTRIAQEPWETRARALERCVRPKQTDNRLHVWEWLRAPDGRILKTDAYDHCAAHDLVGCQDIAWDVVGAIYEFRLSPTEQQSLIDALERKAVTIDHALLTLLRPCYLAFQIGLFAPSAEACDEGQAVTLDSLRRFYVQALRLAIASG